MPKDYRKATDHERGMRLMRLQEDNIKVNQDIMDLATIASTYLNTRRCEVCLRLNNHGYVCCHCGWDGSDSDE